MRFVFVEVTNVLGLHGSVDFAGNPTLLYGRNLAGKTNLINLIRYCFVSRKTSKIYTEEKRLSKDELLLNQAKEGHASFYFHHRNGLYRLEYSFKRRTHATGQKVNLYEAKTFPQLSEKAVDSLRNLEWNLLASNASQLKEEFGEVGIYPDIIDVLISPSNVRNFSDAVNDKLVTIPDIIAKQISNVNKGATRLVDNLQRLQQSVLVQEKESYAEKFKSLKGKFGNQSSVREEELVTIFTLGSATRNLGERLAGVDQELSRLPSEEIQLELLKQKWAPAFNDKLLKIREAKGILQEQKEAMSQRKTLSLIDRNTEALKDLQASLRNLPAKGNIVALQGFAIPSVKSIRFKLLLNPQRIRKALEELETAKRSLKRASQIAKEYRVSLRLSEVASLVSSYKQLLKAIKSPKPKPKGDEAMITYSKEDKQSHVFIPVSTLVKNPAYLRGIEPTPSVYKTTALSGKRLNAVVKEIKAKMQDLEKCRVKLKWAIDANEATKKLFPSLSDEIRYLGSKEKDVDRKLRSLLSTWEIRISSLSEVFALKPFQHNLDSVDGIREFASSCEPILKIAESNLIADFKNALSSFGVKVPRELDIEKITIDDLLKKQSTELLAKKDRLENIKNWINSNLGEVKETEDKLVTIRFLETAVTVLSTILDKIREHTSYEAMAEQIAQSIEENVRTCVQMILPEELVAFRHVGHGDFMVQTVTGEPITHPAGSHKAVISLGIMLALSQLFDLPLILDEASERFDYITLRNTFQLVSMLGVTPNSPQICFVSPMTLNIERNPEVLDIIKNWNIYLFERKAQLEKNIIKVSELSQISA